MTLDGFAELIAAVDPGARHYGSAVRGNFTTWAEYRRIARPADGRNGGGWRIQVDRYTDTDEDAIAQALYDAFDSRDEIAVSHVVDHSIDNGKLTIRHIFDLEVY